MTTVLQTKEKTPFANKDQASKTIGTGEPESTKGPKINVGVCDDVRKTVARKNSEIAKLSALTRTSEELELAPNQGGASDIASYQSQNFQKLSTTSRILVDKRGGISPRQAINEIDQIDRGRGVADAATLCDSDVMRQQKSSGRIDNSGLYYPYQTPQGNFEPGFKKPNLLEKGAILSINGARGGLYQYGDPKLAEKLHALEKNGKKLTGYTGLMIDEMAGDKVGWFAVHFTTKDSSGNSVDKIGQFFIEDCPQETRRVRGYKQWKAIADVLQATDANGKTRLEKIVEYFMK